VTVLSNQDKNCIDKPQTSPLQYTGLEFRAPLISFGGNRAPVHLCRPARLSGTTRSIGTGNGHMDPSPPLQLYKASPLCHQVTISMWGFLPKVITPAAATTMEISPAQETCQQFATAVQSSVEKQVSSPVSSTSSTPLAFLNTFFKSLI